VCIERQQNALILLTVPFLSYPRDWAIQPFTFRREFPSTKPHNSFRMPTEIIRRRGGSGERGERKRKSDQWKGRTTRERSFKMFLFGRKFQRNFMRLRSREEHILDLTRRKRNWKRNGSRTPEIEQDQLWWIVRIVRAFHKGEATVESSVTKAILHGAWEMMLISRRHFHIR
jgi:hypothetical protein